jgi:DNA (cytosine-5)-methyltransferase 1
VKFKTPEIPKLLDLFCGAGGAGEGYRRAGFHVVAVDIVPQKHNPHEFYQDDALHVLDMLLSGEEWNGYRLHDFQVIHASPPCQEYSIASMRYRQQGKHYPELIGPIRKRLERSGLAWVIENVPGAPLRSPVMLCGSMFGLVVRRHRLFEIPCANPLLFAPFSCRHDYIAVTVCGNGTPGWGRKRLGHTISVAMKKEAMGIDWMNRYELSQAIPPAYTHWIGQQLMAIVESDGITA